MLCLYCKNSVDLSNSTCCKYGPFWRINCYCCNKSFISTKIPEFINDVRNVNIIVEQSIVHCFYVAFKNLLDNNSIIYRESISKTTESKYIIINHNIIRISSHKTYIEYKRLITVDVITDVNSIVNDILNNKFFKIKDKKTHFYFK